MTVNTIVHSMSNKKHTLKREYHNGVLSNIIVPSTYLLYVQIRWPQPSSDRRRSDNKKAKEVYTVNETYLTVRGVPRIRLFVRIVRWLLYALGPGDASSPSRDFCCGFSITRGFGKRLLRRESLPKQDTRNSSVQQTALHDPCLRRLEHLDSRA
jgi:hypothetical protein